MRISLRLGLWAGLGVVGMAVLAAAASVLDDSPELAPALPTDPVALALLSDDPLEAARISANPDVAARAARVACASADAATARPACYEEFLERRLAAAGVEDALATLRRLATIDPGVDVDGHVYAHGLGIAAYALEPELARTFARCPPMFSSGCYHGVLQAYFEDDARRSSELDRVCASYKGENGNPWLLFQCVHGMGHGLVMYRDHDLPRALADCDRLTEGWDRESCYGGAFMENIMAAVFPHHPASQFAARHQHEQASGQHGSSPPTTFRPLDPADPLYPCSIMARRYLEACYLIQTAAILHLNGGDIGAASRTCRTAPPDLRATCFTSLGRDITSYARNDQAESVRLCGLVEVSDRPDCYYGALKVFVDLDAETEPGFAFCRKVETAGKARCYEGLGEQIGSLEAEIPERTALCDRAEREFVEACRYGARVIDSRPALLSRES